MIITYALYLMPNSPKKDRPRVQFVCDHWIKEFLDEWANAENRSTSNLIETIVLDAVQAKQAEGELPKPPQPLKQRKTKEDK